MRLVTTGDKVREAADGETDGVVDTTTLDRPGLDELLGRLVDEGAGDLVGRLYEDHPELSDDGSSDSGTHVEDGEEQGGEEPDVEEQGGLVTVKTVYPESSPYHGMPGLEGPVGSWVATMSQDLAGMGIDPASAVTSVELWWPAPPNTHYEVGAMVGGTYAKFDLTAGGYRLIHNAAQPVAGDYYQGASVYDTSSVTAGDLYGTFLQVAEANGPFDMDTNDCERFATQLCGQLTGTWQQQNEAGF